MKARYLFILFTPLLILACLELLALQCLEEPSTVFYSVSNEENWMVWDGKHREYNKIDPLLAWAISDNSFIENDYSTAYNCVVLSTNINITEKVFKIYISGGSTSDIVFDKENWPSKLLGHLSEKNIHAEIYVAAVGGYNTGQELLKTLRDISFIKPDLHISYNGANEVENSGFVTKYEELLFKKAFENKYFGLFPNLINWIKKPSSSFQIYNSPPKSAPQIWQENMSVMNAISNSYNYHFIGILQPVLNYGNSVIPSEMNKDLMEDYIEDYNSFYPAAMQEAESQEYLRNFTSIFNNHSEEQVFKDDCHLISSELQTELAVSIYEEIKHLFSNPTP